MFPDSTAGWPRAPGLQVRIGWQSPFNGDLRQSPAPSLNLPEGKKDSQITASPES